jgi:hypothetical protein
MSEENIIVKQKRGRKPKNLLQNKNEELVVSLTEYVVLDAENKLLDECIINKELMEDIKNAPIKKRGRKPKGGKIIQQKTETTNNDSDTKPSVILHLKCFLKDLDMNILNSNVE